MMSCLIFAFVVHMFYGSLRRAVVDDTAEILSCLCLGFFWLRVHPVKHGTRQFRVMFGPVPVGGGMLGGAGRKGVSSVKDSKQYQQ